MAGLLLHASCVAISGQGILLAGEPGAGKSETALQLIDRGAVLVSDDQTALDAEDGRLTASAPPAIAGLIEARYVGLLRTPFCASAPVSLYVELIQSPEKPERLPDADRIFLLDRPVRRLRLPSHESSNPAKIRAALLYERVD